MRRVVLIVFLSVVVIVSKGQANISDNAIIRSVYGMEKRDLIAKHMKIDVSHSELFWKLYDEYETERMLTALKRSNNIFIYADKYEGLTESDADLLIKTSIEIQTEFVKLWDKTYKKISKTLSAVTAARFIQAEMFLESVIRQELALEIPLIGEFDVN